MALRICRIIALFVLFFALVPTSFASRHSLGTRDNGHSYRYRTPHKSKVRGHGDGHYVNGHSKSHKGGHYKNQHTSNHYRDRKSGISR